MAIDNLKTLAQRVKSSMNFRANPCNDFFEYACGSWNSNASNDKYMPRAFAIAEATYEARMQRLYASIVSNTSSLAYKLHKQCLRDLPGLIGVSVPAVVEILDWVQNANPREFFKVLASLFSLTQDAVFFGSEGLTPWILNASTVYHVAIGPSFTDTSKTAQILKKYSILYSLLPANSTIDLIKGISLINSISRKFTFIENEANAILSKYRRKGIRDLLSDGVIIRASLNQLKTISPQLHWDAFWEQLNIRANDFEVTVPTFFANLSMVFEDIFADEDKFLAVKLLVEAQFLEFFDGLIPSNKNEDISKWCLMAYSEALSSNIFPLYTQAYVSDTTKQRVTHMLRNIIQKLENNMDLITWLDQPTRNAAKEKAREFSLNIGGPKEWELPDVQPEKNFVDSYLEVQNAIVYDSLELASQPINREEEIWDRNLFTESPVNAFYDPTQNGIFIESPTISDPFYIEEAPLVFNYAGMGAVLGHEATHGFDNSGSQFDKDGSFINWWSENSFKKFEEKKMCIIDFYKNANYHLEYSGNRPVSGELTQGENIADFGGVKFGFMAWKEALQNGEEIYSEEDIQKAFGMPSEQLFFVAFSQIWCQPVPPGFRPDVHSPSPLRVLGPLTNSKFFQGAFGCPVGSQFHPKPDLCEIW